MVFIHKRNGSQIKSSNNNPSFNKEKFPDLHNTPKLEEILSNLGKLSKKFREKNYKVTVHKPNKKNILL